SSEICVGKKPELVISCMGYKNVPVLTRHTAPASVLCSDQADGAPEVLRTSSAPPSPPARASASGKRFNHGSRPVMHGPARRRLSNVKCAKVSALETKARTCIQGGSRLAPSVRRPVQDRTR